MALSRGCEAAVVVVQQHRDAGAAEELPRDHRIEIAVAIKISQRDRGRGKLRVVARAERAPRGVQQRVARLAEHLASEREN
ncbi:MAG: hypothetical protein AB1486_02350 [Planctomycetota bacterium]